VITTDLGDIELEKDEIIQAFEAPNSLLFYLQPNFKPDKTLRSYTFIGGGFGHGVGLSQTGSYQLGDLGWSYDRILSFYYPGTQLQPLSSSITLWRTPEVATATTK
jgi:SpoIID/LytB domain protein